MYSVIIVDREESIRKSLMRIIPWAQLGYEVVASFSSAYKALDHIRENHVDVILTDMKVYHMSGLAMVEKAKEINPDLKAVVMTKFKDFPKLKDSIHVTVDDYIVKPLLPNEIENTFRALYDSEYDVELHATNGDVERCYEMIDMISDKSVLFGGENILKSEDVKHKLGLIEIVDSPELIEKTLDVLDDIIHYSKGDYIAFIAPEMQFHAALINLLDIYSGHRDVDYRVMVGSDVYWTDDIIPSFWSAFDLIRKTEYHTVSRFNDMYLEEVLGIVREARNTIVRDIEAKNWISLELSLDEIIGKVRKLSIVNQGYVYWVLMFKLMSYFSIESDKFDFLHTIQRYKYPFLLEDGFIKDLMQLIKGIQSKNISNSDLLVRKTKEIIHRRYYEQSLSLSLISEQLGISYGYLSTIFTKKVAQSFMSYLVSVRMKEAKKLLLSRKYRIFEIAERVGYANTKYFTEAFQKYYGASPVKYLKNLS